eukprot:364743-Chlamydomonas_euryale.AAC.17
MDIACNVSALATLHGAPARIHVVTNACSSSHCIELLLTGTPDSSRVPSCAAAGATGGEAVGRGRPTRPANHARQPPHRCAERNVALAAASTSSDAAVLTSTNTNSSARSARGSSTTAGTAALNGSSGAHSTYRLNTQRLTMAASSQWLVQSGRLNGCPPPRLRLKVSAAMMSCQHVMMNNTPVSTCRSLVGTSSAGLLFGSNGTKLGWLRSASSANTWNSIITSSCPTTGRMTALDSTWLGGRCGASEAAGRVRPMSDASSVVLVVADDEAEGVEQRQRQHLHVRQAPSAGPRQRACPREERVGRKQAAPRGSALVWQRWVMACVTGRGKRPDAPAAALPSCLLTPRNALGVC